jgi:hypothetical protein
MNDVLEWVEKAATDNLRDHLQAAEGITKEANQTLTMLMAALGGAFGFAVGASEFRFSAGAMALFLFVAGVALVTRCLVVDEFPSIANEPKNLMQEGFELPALRKAELKNMQYRIEDAIRRNTMRALSLNRIRLAAISSPAIFLLAEVGRLCVTALVAG